MNLPGRTSRAGVGRAGRIGGFTLTEVLVVISIIVLLIAIALPAFSGLLKNSEESLADNQLRVAISAGRDAAIRSDSGDGAVVFFFTPGGRVTAVPCVQIGQFVSDTVMNGPQAVGAATRDVFAPLPEVEPLAMPKGWSVRGYAPAGWISDDTVALPEIPNGWFESLTNRTSATNNWVFPETGFTTPSSSSDTAVMTRGWQRQSFMVRFKAGTGELDTSGRVALVVDPLPVPDSFRTGTLWDGAATGPTLARQLALSPSRFARIALSRDGLNAGQRAQLVGDRSADTVLCRPVTEIAMYRELSLASGLGVTLNKASGTLYLPRADDSAGAVIDPEIMTELGVNSPDEVMDQVGQWIMGDLRRPSSPEPVTTDARVYTIERYLGRVREILPDEDETENTP